MNWLVSRWLGRRSMAEADAKMVAEGRLAKELGRFLSATDYAALNARVSALVDSGVDEQLWENARLHFGYPKPDDAVLHDSDPDA